MAVSLHTSDLPVTLNDEFWQDLVDNFLQIQKALNGDKSDDSGDNPINDRLTQLEARINRISVSGIDQIALENAVEDVLRRKGVIS